MKKKLFVGLAIGLLMFGMVGMTQAEVIVDTGNNNIGNTWSLSSDQQYAGRHGIIF